MICCPKCRLEIPLADVNVATDQALCRRCGLSHRYHETAAMMWPDAEFDIDRPPRHVGVADDGFQQTLRFRRVNPIVLFLIPFTAVWSGLSIGGIYVSPLLKGQTPSIGEMLFGLPFLFGTVFLLAVILFGLFGKLMVKLQGTEGVVFQGIGPLGRRQTFNPLEMESVRIADSNAMTNGKRWKNIELTFRNRNPVRFGGMLTEEAQQFFAQCLARRLTRTGRRL